MSAISQIHLNCLILMALIIKERGRFLSQTTGEVISELSSSVFFPEIPSICDGLAWKMWGCREWGRQTQTSLTICLLILLAFIKIVWGGKKGKNILHLKRTGHFIHKLCEWNAPTHIRTNTEDENIRCWLSANPWPMATLHPNAVHSPILWKNFQAGQQPHASTGLSL